MLEKYIAILRGINVGGRRWMKMLEFRNLLAAHGFVHVRTYIQSGNIIFESKEESTVKLEDKISSLIEEHYTYDVPVIVRTVDEWKTAIDENPYVERTEIEKLHLTFLKAVPTKEQLELIETYDYSPDLFDIKKQNVYLYCEGKYHKTKLSNKFFENKLKVSTTTRNWKSVLKIYNLAIESL